MEALVKQTSVKLSTSESHGSNRTGVASGRFKLLYFQEGLVYDQKHLFLNHFNRLLVIDTENPIDPQYIIDDEESLVGVPHSENLNTLVRLHQVMSEFAVDD